MSDMDRQEIGRTAVLLCVSVLLAANLAQSAHICGLPSPNLGREAQFGSQAPVTGPCLICMMGQPATAALLFLILLLLATQKETRRRLESHPRVLLEAFRLYVRPPPAF